MPRTKQFKLKIVRINLKSEFKGGKIINELTLDLDGGFRYKKTYVGPKEDPILRMNVGDGIIATVSVVDNSVVRVKQSE